jgi:hypothetical protein
VAESERYRLVRLANGVHSVHSVAHRETFHPVIGPAAEAQALYVRQLRLRERLQRQQGEFVIWDVGLGAAANALTVLRAAAGLPCPVRLLSFDHTTEPLEFGLGHASRLGYFEGYEEPVRALLAEGKAEFKQESQPARWEFHQGDFPSLVEGWLTAPKEARPPAPHAILFDAYSPARNPAMWTGGLFAGLYQLLEAARPCALPTYSRSTMLRVSLLLAGFYVGVGHATGEKEETTLAANTLELVEEPLGARWLDRARHSTSAEPLWEAVYRQAPLSGPTWERLRGHPQFHGSRPDR